MKKIMKFAAVAVAIVAAASCAKEIENPSVEKVEIPAGYVQKTFTFNLAEATKADFDVEAKKVVWAAGDKVAVFDGTSKCEFTVVEGTINGGSADFTGMVAEGATDLYVSYPFASADKVQDGLVFNEIPLVQTVAEGACVDPAALVLAGKVDAEGNAALKNVVALIKFQVAEPAVSVSFRATGANLLSGPAAADPATGKINNSVTNGTRTYITLNGNFVPEKDYYAASYDKNLTEGFIASVTTAEGVKKVKRTEKKSIVLERGKILPIGVISATDVLPYEISTAAELRTFAKYGEVYLDDETVVLTADIDLEGQAWEGAHRFFATFDGQNHKISGIVCKDDTRAGLIKTLGDGTHVATLKNLVVGSADGAAYDGVSKFSIVGPSTNTGAYSYASIVAYAHKKSVIENVVNFAKVEAESSFDIAHRIGGVAGTLKDGAVMRGCINHAEIVDNAVTDDSLKGYSLGGLTGAVDGAGALVENCVNYGDVINNSIHTQHLGGISGCHNYASEIKDCVNNAKIVNNAATVGSASGYAIRLGGITGSSAGKAILNKCVNNGEVTQTVALPSGYHMGLAGISGVATGPTIIKGCKNTALIHPTTVATATSTCLGGIIGYVTGSSSYVQVGKADDDTVTENTGTFTQVVNYGGSTFVGGIVGYDNGGAKSTYTECKNSGTISTTKVLAATIKVYLGGIVGAPVNADLINCVNDGVVDCYAGDNKATFYAAGIAGGNGKNKIIRGCVNNGKIMIRKGTSDSRLGGICCSFYTEDQMSDCVVNGQIYASRGTTVNVGAFTAYLESNVKAAEKTIFEGCVANMESVLVSSNALGAPADGDTAATGNLGLLIGSCGGNTAGVLNLGSAAKPVKIKEGMPILNTDSDEIAKINGNEGTLGYYMDHLTGYTVDRDAKKLTFNVELY